MKKNLNDFWWMFWEFKSQAVLILCNTEENGQVIRNLASCFGRIHNGLSQSQCAFQLADKTSVLCMAFNLANKVVLLTYRKQAIPSGQQDCRSLKPMANC